MPLYSSIMKNPFPYTSSSPLRPLAIAAALCATSVFAQTRDVLPPASGSAPVLDNSNSMLNASDRTFLSKAARINVEDVGISRFATERAVRPEVRAFAAEFLAAHGSIDAEISRLASAKSTKLGEVSFVDAKKWAEKKPTSFDKEYMKLIVANQKKAVGLYEEAAREAKDLDVAAFARNQLATLNGHLRKAEDLKKIVD